MCAKLCNYLLFICKHLSSDFDQQITTCVLQMIHSSIKFGAWCQKSILEVQSQKGAFHGVPGAWTDLLLAVAVMWSMGLAGQEELIRSQCSLNWSHSCGHK